MNDVDNGRDEHVWIHGLSDVRLKTGAFSARYVGSAHETEIKAL
jgi:hypothetical protein